MGFFRGKKFIAESLVLILTAGCCVPCLHAHPEHDGMDSFSQVEIPVHALENPDENIQNELNCYASLFLELAGTSPGELQDDLIACAVEISQARDASDGGRPENLLLEAAQLYEKLEEQRGHVHLTYMEKGLQLDGGQSPVSLAATLPRVMLVEIHNDTSRTIELLNHADSEKDRKRISIPPGETRVALKTLVVKDIVSHIDLELMVSDKEHRRESIELPVEVSPPATIKGRILDSRTGDPWPGRIQALSSYNQYCHAPKYAENKTLSEKMILPPLPAGKQFYKLPFFYSDGTFELQVPAGLTRLTLERGFEHEVVTRELDLKPGQTVDVHLASGRMIDMKALGWISGDTHIHWVKNHWSENEDLGLLAMVQRAEDIRVVNNLTLLHRTADIAFIAPSHHPMGPVPGYCDSEYHIQMAEEYRNEEFYGHLCLLNIYRLILPVSTGRGMAGPDAPDYPLNKTAMEDCRSQGGISVEAHGLGLNWDVPVNVLNRLSDSLDQIDPSDYYRFLDCGFRMPLTNGSDHPARVAGCARAYVKIDGDFSYEKWIDGIRKRRTFTTSGPLLFFSVNGKDIGSELDVKPGTPLEIKAKVLSRYPVGNFQVISNSEVLSGKHVDGRTAELTLTLEADQPRWFAVRCSTDENLNAVLSKNTAHTSAIYVNVNGNGVLKPEAAAYWAGRMHEHADDIAQRGVFVTDTQRSEAVGYAREGAMRYEEMASEATSRAE